MLHYALVSVGPEQVQDSGAPSQSCPSESQKAPSKGAAGGSGSEKSGPRPRLPLAPCASPPPRLGFCPARTGQREDEL